MTTPSLYQHLKDVQTLGAAFLHVASVDPSAPVVRYPVASAVDSTRIWHTLTYADILPQISRVAHYLASRDVTVGTPVAIISNSRFEWMITDMAIQILGGITVSVYQSLTPSEIGFILYDSGAKVICIENEEQLQKLYWLNENRCEIPERETIESELVQIPMKTVISFEPINSSEACGTNALSITEFKTIVEDNSIATSPPAISDKLSRTSTSSYVYTSGTTGPPKGVIQSHGNHLVNVLQASLCGVFGGDARLFLYLPLAHSFARLIYHAGFITSTSLILPAVIDHKTSRLDLSSIARDIRESNCDVLPSVPRLFEKMATAVKTKASTKSIQGLLLRACLANASKVQHQNETEGAADFLSTIAYGIFAPLRNKISGQLFGTSLQHAISGGAKLDPSVTRFFDGLGVTICEGYGLTETAVATHVNVPGSRKIGSVGKAFPDVEVKISPDDNEISIRGPNVAHGYLNRPIATKDSWSSDAWFSTGDVGRTDEDGFLFITDRKKELVITAGGKKIPPSSIEGLFKGSPFISHAFFYGEGKPYCIALFTLNDADVRANLSNRDIMLSTTQSLVGHPVVVDEIAQTVAAINSNLASYETIKKYVILPEDFSIENGLLTPTMKMKRKKIVERFKKEIDSLYET